MLGSKAILAMTLAEQLTERDMEAEEEKLYVRMEADLDKIEQGEREEFQMLMDNGQGKIDDGEFNIHARARRRRWRDQQRALEAGVVAAAVGRVAAAANGRVAPSKQLKEAKRVAPSKQLTETAARVAPSKQPPAETPRVAPSKQPPTECPRVAPSKQPPSESPRVAPSKQPPTESPRVAPSKQPPSESPRVAPSKQLFDAHCRIVPAWDEGTAATEEETCDEYSDDESSTGEGGNDHSIDGFEWDAKPPLNWGLDPPRVSTGE
jgi:outer membrane biosynthesis protein TonB